MTHKLAFRQIHLDFHTSEAIKGIGRNFSRKQFQAALKKGHVNSITVFSKCHHGWAYHPSRANEMHPGLDFDLLGEMISAAHEIGVKTPVYLSTGLDEKMARRHPEWLIRDEGEKMSWTPDFMHAGFHEMCLNSPYLEYFLKQIEEVLTCYDADGLFLDITGIKRCYCQNCVGAAIREGMDPRDTAYMLGIWENTFMNYATRVKELVERLKPGIGIYHNAGCIRKRFRDYAAMDTHLEVESLPTGGWGYDHFPLSARYAQGFGMEYLGMTGKFHTSWGEFGGFKHPNALKYEVTLSLANGAKCSIGDQLHPEGLMDEATYTLIGEAYQEVEQKEPWCDNVTAVADVAVFSSQSLHAVEGDVELCDMADTGAVRMLLEGKLLFDVVDQMSDLSRYKVLVLPDNIRLNEVLQEKLQQFLAGGGKILASGESCLMTGDDVFGVDLGVTWIGRSEYSPDYCRPGFKLKSFGEASFVCYGKGYRVDLHGGREIAARQNPYFNRDIFHFCSHQHTPNSFVYGGPGMVESANGIYIAWSAFEDYARVGSLHLKEMVLYAVDRLLGSGKTLHTDLPAQGVVTLMKQDMNKRYICHTLYAVPVRRGKDIEIIEDIVPLYGVSVSVQLTEEVKKVYLAPQMEEIPFEASGHMVSFTIPELHCHQMVVLDI